jgi:hypothetical protein
MLIAMGGLRTQLVWLVVRHLDERQMVEFAQRMLRERRYSGLYTVTIAAIRRFTQSAELRLLHGTALVLDQA